MKSSLTIAVMAALLFSTGSLAGDVRTQVVESHPHCQHLLLQGQTGYLVVKVQDGVLPPKKSVVEGFVDSLGVTHLTNVSNKAVTWVYIDKLWVNKKEAYNRFKGVCKIPPKKILGIPVPYTGS